jgi:predicted dehydrogenase
MERRPRCVFVGLGTWGRRLLSRVDGHFEVAALVSAGGPDSVAWSAAHYPRTPHLIGLPEALRLPAIDAVFLATPTPTHVALTCHALEAGCHVFVEKPLAVDADGAARVVSLARRSDLEVFIGYVYLFHRGLNFLRAVAPAERIRTLRFDWVRPQLNGPLHEELLCHDLAVTVALTGELPDNVVVTESGRRLLRCRIELPSGRSCESTLRLRDDVPRRRIVAARFAGGAAYTWHDDRVHVPADPDGDLLEPETEDPVTREIRAFRSAIEGTGVRMVDDERLSIGIGRLLDEVGRSVAR